MPSRSAARAIASASIGSDFPRSRTPRRASAINLRGSRTTVSPRSIKNRSSDPDTCRTSSITHTRSLSSLRRPLQQLTEPLTPRSDRSLRDLHAERVDRDPGVRLLVRIDPDRQHPVPSLHSNEPMKRTPGGHFSVGAMPRSLSVQGSRRKPRGLVVRECTTGPRGGAWARSVVLIVCARAPSLISVRGP